MNDICRKSVVFRGAGARANRTIFHRRSRCNDTPRAVNL